MLPADDDAVLFFSPVAQEPFISDRLGSDLRLQGQSGNDLGARMHNAFSWTFRQGYKRAVLIGSDSPNIDQKLIPYAFAALEKKELVIGPSNDGGYYLIGLRRPRPELFENMTWSVDSVYRETLRRARAAKLAITTLAEKTDIDAIDDLRRVWRMHRAGEIRLGKRTKQILQIIFASKTFIVSS